MFLSDTEIKARLKELNFEVGNKDFPFDPSDQIQPCSVDLRLSDVFWKPKKRWAIDLRKKQLLHLSPRRYYESFVLEEGESYTLKPGKLLLGRVHEKYTIPEDCAGNITGRSSFARFGLMIHCTGNFINPGYRGHMPLQIVNLGSNSIKIFPFLSICQLNLVKLSSIPEVQYGENEIHSKYMDDDGGPSYIWRDQSFQNLQNVFAKANIEVKIQNQITGLIGEENLEIEIIERLEKRISRSKPPELENYFTILEAFSKSEDNRKSWRQIFIFSARGLFVFFCGLSLPTLLSQPYTSWHYAFWILTVISVFVSIFAFRIEVGDHLDKRTLKKIQNKSEKKVKPDTSEESILSS